jgi:hypothetical protein
LSFSPCITSAEVKITVGNGAGLPGSTDNPVAVNLDNLDNKIRGVQLDVCDDNNYLSGTGCETTSRSSNFTCTVNEGENGCLRVILISFASDRIEEGTGPILTIKYDAAQNASEGLCVKLNPKDADISDSSNVPLPDNETSLEPGEFCFVESSTTTTTTSSLWSRVYEKLWGIEKEKNLRLLRSFRDEIMAKNDLGLDYIFLLYSNSIEIASLLQQDEYLRLEVKRLIDEMIPQIKSRMEGNNAVISAEQVSQIESLLNYFERKASSAGLKNAVKKVKNDLRQGLIFKNFGISPGVYHSKR